ncbi:MAG: RHS repeat-associated core domain-containing protein [bacterium]|nr:RHS repeat-associated core domain-containing protein [bacterium]
MFDSNNTPLTASAIENPYLFTGRRYDPESGNYYYRARIYSPELGRFLQTDPLGYVDGLNLYAYVGNNPASWVDPLGLFLDGGVLTGPALYLLGGAVAGGVIAAYPETREAVAAAAEHLAGAVKRFPGNVANVYGQLKDLFAPPPAAIDEIDGEDDTVPPIEAEDKFCEVDPGKKPPIPKAWIHQTVAYEVLS